MRAFLFTDIERSAYLWSRFGEAMKAALACHDRLIREAVAAAGGVVVKHTGDGIFAVFDGGEPLACALEIQRLVAAADWGEIDALRIRIGVHAGEAQERDGDYFGAAVNCAARLMQAAWGGQVLLSAEAASGALPSGAALGDLGIHILKDLGSPVHLYQLCPAGSDGRDFPPPRTLSARPNNLPAQATPFVGRDEELASVRSCLGADGCRMLTLLGPGGIGKTRLALQVGAELLDEFEWGAYFVPLAPVASPADVVAATAEALNFRFYGKGPAEDQLLAYIGDKHMLLILDNFEHLMAAAAFVAKIIAASPNVKILVTSRERLNIRAENVYRVEGMSYPRAADAPAPESYGAVRLFAECARRSDPSFKADGAALPSIIAVCRLVEGVPLAVELAASWVRVLAVSEIAAELRKGFDALETAAPDIPARHRSFRAVWDYSYELLADAERAALAKLAVFPGSFERRAAHKVAGADLRTLSSLADKSLVRRAGGDRFEIHPLLRQYARAKMGPADEAAGETRFADYYLSLLAEIHHTARREGQVWFIRSVAAEIDNVRAAWQNAAARGELVALGDASIPLYTYYRTTGRFDEGARLLADGAAVIVSDDGPLSMRSRARLLARVGNLKTLAGMKAEAGEVIARAIALATRAGDEDATAFALNMAGTVQYYGGRRDRARRLYNAALANYERRGDSEGAAAVTHNLGTLAAVEGRYDDARQLFHRTLEICRETGDVNRIANIANNLGSVEAWQGNIDLAETYYAECLAASREIGNLRLVATALYNLATAAAEKDDNGRARTLFQESLAVALQANDYLSAATIHANIAETYIVEKDYDKACGECEEGLRKAARVDRPDGYAHCQWRLGDACVGLGDFNRAEVALIAALRCARALNDTRLAVGVMTSLGNLRMTAGAPDEGAEILYAALAAAPDAVLARLTRATIAQWFGDAEPPSARPMEEIMAALLAGDNAGPAAATS